VRPEDVPQNHSRAPGIYRDRAGWRTLINCVLNIPGIGSAQRHVIKRWPFDTPLEEMQQWRAEAKARIEAQLQEQLDAAFRELETLRKEVARPCRTKAKEPAASFAEMKDQLAAAEREVAAQRATIRKLNDELAVVRRRQELPEASAREIAGRAYRFAAAAAGGRR
jgi:uncharacterized protein YPO0396